MKDGLLSQAQRSLRIEDVLLREAHTRLADGFEPKYSDDAAVQVEHRCHTRSSQIVEIATGKAKRRVFRVRVELGVRWIHQPAPKAEKVRDGGDAHKEPEVLVRIEATFIAEYAMMDEIDPAALKEFALQNAPWHVWPYWREFVSSQCARLNMSKIAMPMMRLPPQPPAQSVDD